MRLILREENCTQWRFRVADGLCHYPKAIIPNCMQLGTNLIIIELTVGGGGSDKFSERLKKKKNVGVERYCSVAKHVCI